ncbi:MAG: 5-(carboxyamino)imidazole ribonucleotide mutase [Candidatus Aminicenantes bacterium]|nr:5-(carboxyamino)imidazole ribonucleotide mutase [Candidatus Aminicenantes bacterium]
MNQKIGIILGSDSDYPFMEKGIAILEKFNIPFEIEVSSAHRTPERTSEIIKEFESTGIKIIIAAAGGAAHLPGVIAAQTLLPVLGVPVDSKLSGVDSLYSIIQMPGGIPVATFGIGNSGGMNAVLFAMEILSLTEQTIKEKLIQFREEQKRQVIEKSNRLKKRIKTE